MRLPHIYKNFSPFESYPEPAKVTQDPINFYLGEDVTFDGYLEFEGNPVNPDDWTLTAVMKASPFASTILWTGELNNGVYFENDKPGYYRIQIPSSVLTPLISGTYWLDLVLKEKLGSHNNMHDRTVIASRIPFGLDYTASSPSVAAPRDAGVERTNPPPTDITML